MKKKSKITTAELANNLKISESYVEKLIKKLKEKNFIERISSNKNGSWKII